MLAIAFLATSLRVEPAAVQCTMMCRNGSVKKQQHHANTNAAKEKVQYMRY